MNTQPEALRLADLFESMAEGYKPAAWIAVKQTDVCDAAAELRCLQAEVEALKARERVLVEALSKMLFAESATYPSFEEGHEAQEAWAEAKAKAKREAGEALASVKGGA
jgi:hypothetical protein